MRTFICLLFLGVASAWGCGAPASHQEPGERANPAQEAVSAVAAATPEAMGTAPLAPASGANAEGSARVRAPESLGTPAPAVEVAAAVILDVDSGALLYEVSPHLRLPPASLTKIATAVVALESLQTGRLVDTQPDPDQEWLDDATTMGLQPGDRFTVKDLLYGLLMASGNDAAKELAREAAGSEPAFVARMNALASKLQLKDTRFSDVHGLGGPEHYSSAYDIAVLSKYAMTIPEFREVVGTESLTLHGSRDLELYNHNPLLNYTPGVNGVKTGFTEEAGNTFAVSVERDGHGIILVMLNAPNRAFDAIDLIEWAYANHRWP